MDIKELELRQKIRKLEKQRDALMGTVKELRSAFRRIGNLSKMNGDIADDTLGKVNNG